MNTVPLITLSIVSHGDAEKVGHLLASLQKHELDTKRFQLILTDNLNDDLPDFDASPWASLHMLRNKHPAGFAQNHNRAFKVVKGEYLAILNPDLILEQPVFEKLLASIQIYQAGLIAPKIVDEYGITQDSFRTMPTPAEIIRRRLPGYHFETIKPDGEGVIRPDWVAGMFWLMRSDFYGKMGGLDERYRLYFEDVDFCTRARLKGIKIVVDSQVQVRHDAQRSSRKNIYFLLLHAWSAALFFTSSVYRQAIRSR